MQNTTRRRAGLCVLLILGMLLAYVSPAFVRNKAAGDVPEVPQTDAKTVELRAGDCVLFGCYAGEAILWRVLDVDARGLPLLMTEYVLCFKAFDAGGTDAAHDGADREKFGSADWNTCTLKTWLNATEQTVTYPHAPNAAALYQGWNAYDAEPGFLSDDNFNAAQRAGIAPDGVFLLTRQQTQTLLPRRVKTATAAAIAGTQAPYRLSASTPVWYWTATPVTSNRVSVTAVTTTGAFYKAMAYDGTVGVCPALYLVGCRVTVNGGDGSDASPYSLVSQGGTEVTA